jgi:serine protease AprX
MMWCWLRRRCGCVSAHGAPAFLIVLLTILLPLSASAQQHRFWITFRDHDEQNLISKADPRTLGISDRALWRRAKILSVDKLVDELDLPVSQRYIDKLREDGVTVRSVSRWFNAVSAELSDDQRIVLSKLPFVRSVGPVMSYRKRQIQPAAPSTAPPLLRMESSTTIDYGQSLTQLSTINVIGVHNAGVTGAGVIIGLLDDGFNQHLVHPALRNIKIIAEYDFVQRDSNTTRAPGEFADEGNHGAGVLSVLGGYESGKLIGVAFGASFILAKTEIDSIEAHVEEDLFVEGLEWMERLGADIASASIGYNDWYTYEDFDGQTATTSKAARIAARKGLLLVTAMGNEGHYRDGRTRSTGTMIAPADADSIVSVGAVTSSGAFASFSSTGPTADGRIKPEVVAQGVAVYVMYGEDGYQHWDGTSFSTPLTAGVAALILSAHPTLTPMQVRDRLMLTARALYDSSVGMTSHPNNFYGWGLVDAMKAVGISSQLPPAGEFILHQNYPNPFNGSTTILVDASAEQTIELSIYDLLGQRVREIYKGKTQPGTNYFQWVNALDDAGIRVPSGVYICRLSAAGWLTAQKIVYIR